MLCKSGAVVQAVDVDDGAGPGRGFTNRADINPTAAANHVIGGSRAKAVRLDERPVVSCQCEMSCHVGDRAGHMRTTERAGAGPQRRVLRCFRQPQTHVDIAAMAAAGMLHPAAQPRPMNERMWFGKIVASYK